MTIQKQIDDKKMTLKLDGRLDTTTAPLLETEIKTSIGDIKELVLDFSNLEYISSAGLRVVLSSQKVMSKQGKMEIHNVNEDIMDVFDVTGFTDILTII